MYSLTFQINKLPPILSNGSHRHWRSVAGIKKAWQQIVILECYGRLPILPLEKANAVFTRHSSTESDYDNLVISFKSIRDGLVKAGVLFDDHPRNLKAEYLWQKTSPKNGYVSVEVTEVG